MDVLTLVPHRVRSAIEAHADATGKRGRPTARASIGALPARHPRSVGPSRSADHALRSIRRRLAAFIAILAVSALGATSSAHAEPESLALGIQPFASPTSLFERYAPLRDWLADTLDTPVRIESARTFSDFFTRSHEGRYDLLLTAPHAVPDLLDAGGYQLVTSSSDRLAAVVLVSLDSPLRNLQDLSGAHIAAPAQESLGSVLIKNLAQQSLSPEIPLPTFQHYPHHGAAVTAMQRGLADAAVIVIDGQTLVARNEIAEGVPRMISLADGSLKRIIGQSEPFPGITLLARANRIPDAAVLGRQLEALAGQPNGRRMLREIGHSGFEAAHASDYAPFRGMLADSLISPPPAAHEH
ncbi:phosphate/phosphite/phosphonate ABC transporter substrate-binding protein [Thioalkalivibrio sp. ALJ7]|uniref:phosphate/phosphite/phosphonate ABC transporter substrate-binding protein n=1 Tax=Thioalkalivibrio sp. ALJ7 TaxID=1158756 RepID=UPI00037BEA8A|nr:PhnD/SsuA/transferrin family substrate-binding protein [Thioalkalivibrio sp. ALJ7]